MSRRRYDETATLDVLKKILADLPKLTGARCIGRHELFDARDKHEAITAAKQRHQHAVALCRQCPVIDECAASGVGERDVGQVRAGQVPEYMTSGRPRRGDVA